MTNIIRATANNSNTNYTKNIILKIYFYLLLINTISFQYTFLVLMGNAAIKKESGDK